jgi:carbamoyl-phosphate synthase large subunit
MDDARAVKKVLVLGSGPAVIGQGGEYDHSATSAVSTLREAGIQVVLLDSNPSTVMSSPTLAHRTYLEPVTAQSVEWLLREEAPDALLPTVGGHSAVAVALELAGSGALERHGASLLGTSVRALTLCADRARFAQFVQGEGLQAPPQGVAGTEAEAQAVAERLGFPLLARGPDAASARGTRLLHAPAELAALALPAVLSRFLRNAVQAEVELLRDGAGNVFVAGVLEHIEEAGVHAGDAAYALPPCSLSVEVVERLKDQATQLANALEVQGHVNVRFAVQGKAVWVLEVNPRATRAVPFVTHVTQVPMARVAALCALGQTLPSLGWEREAVPRVVGVREAVFPFARSAANDVLLGTQMQSTGEVVGISSDHATAFAKAQLAAGVRFPAAGQAVFLSVRDDDKPAMVDLARRLRALGHPVLTTEGTRRYLEEKRVPTEGVLKVVQGSPNAEDLLREGRIGMVINTTSGRQSMDDGYRVRREALTRGVAYFTTAQAARMAVEALEALRKGPLTLRALQDR